MRDLKRIGSAFLDDPHQMDHTIKSLQRLGQPVSITVIHDRNIQTVTKLVDKRLARASRADNGANFVCFRDLTNQATTQIAVGTRNCNFHFLRSYWREERR